MAFIIAITPIFLAATSADRVLTADRPEFYAALARLWIAGFAVGLVVVLGYAARGSLIVRDPAKIATNLRRNQRIGLLVVPFAFFLQHALPVSDWLPRADPRVLVILVLGGFLVPLWAVVLYITFAIRPDEIFSGDPVKARAALERLRGEPQPGPETPRQDR